MADDRKAPDVIDRVVEKKSRTEGLSIAERAAARLATLAPGTAAPPPPAPAKSPAGHAGADGTPTPPVPPAPTRENARGNGTVAEAPARPSPPPPPGSPPPGSPPPGSAPRPAAAPPQTETPGADTAPQEAPDGDDTARRKSNYLEIDLVKLQLAGAVTPHSQRSRIAEEFRVIKRPLLRRAFATGEENLENGHVVLITSARPGEGKTETTINLGMSLASERELHVLIIDGDAQKGELGHRLGLKNRLGLVDMLLDESLELPDVLVRTNIPNLSIVPAGTDHPEATELLASPRMINLTKDIAGRYKDRIILIDAPPILASTEPSVLAQLVGQIVMVVENGATSREAVEKSLPLISACRDISFVLNKVRFQATFDRYGAYGYQYNQSQGAQG